MAKSKKTRRTKKLNPDKEIQEYIPDDPETIRVLKQFFNSLKEPKPKQKTLF